MRRTALSRLIVTGLITGSCAVNASPQSFNSARSFSMGGTGVASAHPAAATSTNPALLAGDHHEWSDDLGVMLPSINVRLADDEKVIDQVDDIQDTIDDLDFSISSSNASDSQTLAGNLKRQLNDLDQDTLRVNAGLGLSVALPGKKLAVGFFANGQLTATVRGEFASEDEALLSSIEAGVIPPSGLVSDQLKSSGRVLASSVSEVGFSFAREFTLDDDSRLQVGVSPKYMDLQSFQYTERIGDFDDSEFDGEEYKTSKTGFNFDLGAAYRFGANDEWQFGAVAKNLIPMELKSAVAQPELGERERVLKIDPKATVGIAHFSDYHVITADLELTETKAFGFENDTQWISVGAEFDAFRFVQLRAGVRHNLANNDDTNGIEEATQFTAGIGANLFGARVDLAGLYSDSEYGAAVELGAAF